MKKKVPVHRIYSLPDGDVRPRDALFYACRTRPRRMTEKERRFGFGGDYMGNETYMSLYEPAGLDDEQRVVEVMYSMLPSSLAERLNACPPMRSATSELGQVTYFRALAECCVVPGGGGCGWTVLPRES